MLRINASYKDARELIPLLKLLAPVVRGLKITQPSEKKPYYHAYITLKEPRMKTGAP